MYSHGAVLRIVAVIGGPRGCRKHHMLSQITDTMQNWENDKRISLTYSQTLCYSRTWRTKVVCSSLMHTQTFTQTRRCRRTCKSACHRVRRLALPLSECSGAVLHSSTFVGHLHFCKKYAWVANPRIFLTCAVVEVGIFAFRSFGVFVHCTSCAMGYSYCYAVGSDACCRTPLQVPSSPWCA